MVPQHSHSYLYVWFGAIVIAVACAVGYAYSTIVTSAETDKQALEAELALMHDRLGATEAENEQLRGLLQSEAAENEAFAVRVEELTSTVGYLDKLSKTDRELLQKYSAVYFLSENFIPNPLVPLNDEMLLRTGTNTQFHGKAFPFLEKMMRAAESVGNPLKVVSAYRSFGTQSALKAQYKVTYGSGANKFSADQGYSEHQLGTAIDFSTEENGDDFNAFKSTEQFRWLTSHAHEYGFVLSYPLGNKYFQFEPWHWRFVGVDLATRLYYENKYFYDLDQREINPYLGRIFDE